MECRVTALAVRNYCCCGKSVANTRLMFVVLVITTNNDITDNSRVFRKKAMPYFVYADGKLILDKGFRDEKEFILVNSNLARLGPRLKNSLRRGAGDQRNTRFAKHRYRAWKDRSPEMPQPGSECSRRRDACGGGN